MSSSFMMSSSAETEVGLFGTLTRLRLRPNIRSSSSLDPSSGSTTVSLPRACGSCWAAIGDGSVPPLRVNAGDVIVFPGGAPNVLSSSPGARAEPNLAMYYNPIDQQLPFTVLHGGGGPERTHFICGYLGCDAHP